MDDSDLLVFIPNAWREKRVCPRSEDPPGCRPRINDVEGSNSFSRGTHWDDLRSYVRVPGRKRVGQIPIGSASSENILARDLGIYPLSNQMLVQNVEQLVGTQCRWAQTWVRLVDVLWSPRDSRLQPKRVSPDDWWEFGSFSSNCQEHCPFKGIHLDRKNWPLKTRKYPGVIVTNLCMCEPKEIDNVHSTTWPCRACGLMSREILNHRVPRSVRQRAGDCGPTPGFISAPWCAFPC